MSLFRLISVAGVDMGTYRAETEQGALEANARDAGYKSVADMHRALPETAEQPLTVTLLESWLAVDLCVACGRGEYDVPAGDNPERRKLLTEYRDGGSMNGAWPCTLEALRAAGADTDDMGVDSESIDWEGL